MVRFEGAYSEVSKHRDPNNIDDLFTRAGQTKYLCLQYFSDIKSFVESHC